jgi:hypothetical protein
MLSQKVAELERELDYLRGAWDLANSAKDTAEQERDRILKELERTLIALTGNETNPVGALDGQYLADAARKMREERDQAIEEADDVRRRHNDCMNVVRAERDEARRLECHWKDRCKLASEEVEKLEAAIKRQAAAVRTLDLKERAEYLATQSLDSERAMNAKLTTEVEELRAELFNRTNAWELLVEKYQGLLELTAAGGQRKSDWQGVL